MNVPAALRIAIAAARRRRVAIVALLALPVVGGAAAIAWRLGGSVAAASTVAAGAVFAGLLAWRSLRGVDATAIARRLDADPAREDSTDLLFREPGTLGPLQRLQRERVASRLGDAATALRAAWPRRALVAAWLAGLAAVTLAIAWPDAIRGVAVPADAAAPPVAQAATHTTLADATLTVTPPAYTALPASTSPQLSAKAPVDSTLRWSLELSPAPRAVDLQFHDGRRVALSETDGRWTGDATLDRSALYRIVVVDGLPLADTTRHRLDAVPDTAPAIRIVAPERSLTLREPGQRTFDLRFEATDDHALGSARWVVTLAQGSGEQVAVSERTLAARGTGDAKVQVFATALDLAALGFAQGDDLIVRLEVADTRTPAPQRTRSASVILRWPPPAGAESTGMEGLVKRALPAYFRSQRQIIIDTEALVAERPRLAGDRFESKADAIGVDQRILRMRYGEFLGEENAGQPDAPAEHDDHDDAPPAGFGGEIDVLEDYGHTHDDAEAATLLDPQTRALLKRALDAMWQSETELRTARPEAALPHQYRALAAIKQVQQATRIYLARVGLELPAIDEARRMTGVRDGIADRRGGLRAADVAASPTLALWRALEAAEGRHDADALRDGTGPDEADAAADDLATALDAFAGWLRDNEAGVDDALGLVEALDTLREQPDCDDCRATLRARLWPLLPAPVPAVLPRAPVDAEGAAYLDALGDGA